MDPSPDIIRDFSALQQECRELGNSNIRFVRENERLKKDLSRLTTTLREVRFVGYQSAEVRQTISRLAEDVIKLHRPKPF